LDNIYLQYPKKRATVLKGVNLGVPKGTSFALIGRNGSGKSTIIKLATAQISKTTGEVWFDGRKILSQGSEIFEETGICPQVNYLIPEMTVSSHLRTLWLTKGAPVSAHERLSRELLRIFGMEEDYRTAIGDLSGGRRRKLSIASSLVGTPKYLFLDEPTIGVDEETRETFAHFVEQLRARCGTTVLWVTHNIEEAERHCQRVGVLSRGEFVKIAPPSALVAEFSRGYNIDFSSRAAQQQLRQDLEPLLEAAFQVYEMKSVGARALRASIPYQRFRLQAALAIVHELSCKGLLVDFQIRFDRLEEVFSHLISTNHS
jgi:ABC-2 type transport system ATP-binding protein